MHRIYPVLLAGGAGTRLWPLSRKTYPKQFCKIIGETTPFQNNAQRLKSSDIVEFCPHITVTHSDYRFVIVEQFDEIGIDPGPILIEPESKNTAAAILAASVFSLSKDNEAVLLVAPSDHVIPDTRGFHEAIKVGLPHVQNEKMVTFGIQPTHPETGYVYLESSKDVIDPSGTSNLVSFVEKPDLKNAERMLASSNFLWSGGIFLFRAKDMINAFRANSTKTLSLVSKAIDNGYPDLGFFRLAAEPWSLLKDLSIEYDIMEKAQNLVVVPFSSKWSDLGGWDAVWSENNPDQAGNVTSETAHAIECSNSLLRSESDAQQVVGIGLDNIMAIAMPDAVLLAHKDRAQEVNKAVKLLKEKGIEQAEVSPIDYRPWGWFERLASGDRFQVKRIFVKPGAAISLQSHSYRSEHWIVVAGTATVTIDDEVKLVTEGQSVYVPLGAKHRMENPGKQPMVLIEVQVGTYFGEDDIIRYDDVYART